MSIVPFTVGMSIWYRICLEADGFLSEGRAINETTEASQKTGAPVAELVRRAIDKYLQERAKELK